MEKETCLDNLRKIMSEKGENIESFPSDIQNTFYQKIADDVFKMPPLYSNGNKIKYMLWNYPQLKNDIKTILADEIISKWKAFKPTLKDASSMGANDLKNPIKTLFEQSKENKPKPPQKDIQTPQMETSEIKNIEKETDSDDVPIPSQVEKTSAMEKPIIEEPAPESTAPVSVVKNTDTVKKSAPSKTTPEKSSTRKPVAKKVVPKKKTATVPTRKTSGIGKKKQNKKNSLKNEVEDLSRNMKSLEGKIERMMKTFDSIAVQETTRTKSVKKKATLKTIKKTSAKLTDTDKVIKIISRRKKSGIDVPSLSEKTGFDSQKIRNIVYRALKNGLIRRIATGLYSGVI